MFTCIACTKPVAEDGDDGARGSGIPSTKEAVKSLTAQVLTSYLSLNIKFFYLLFPVSFSFNLILCLIPKTNIQTKS